MTGSVNAILERLKSYEGHIARLETVDTPRQTINVEEVQLMGPRTEAGLKDIGKLPECVKELQVFDGNPSQYLTWIHNIGGILKDYEIIRAKPLYKQKVRGSADPALVSYNVFDSEWDSIKRILSLHYADKRDIRTLEHQLNQLTQKNKHL